MKLLIVEDNARIRQLVRHALCGIADQILESEDGADAIEAYQACHPDLVLMDIRMPRLDGLSATRQLIKRFPSAKVLMLTDYDDDELRSAAADAGACGYALKLDLGELESIVARVRREEKSDGEVKLPFSEI